MELHQKPAVIEWVDMAKGLGMLLVMLGHVESPLSPFIYSFHMPLFFFLSGYLYHEHKYPTPMAILHNKSRRLLIPYFFFAIANCFISLLFGHKVHGNTVTIFLKHLAGPFIAIHGTDWTALIGPYWFISCLLLTELFYCVIVMVIRRVDLRLAVSALLAAGGFIYAEHVGQVLPWSIETVPVAILFFCAGHSIQQYCSSISRRLWWGLVLALPCIALSSRQSIDMSLCRYENPILFIVGAFAGIFAFLLVVCQLPSARPIRFVGANSMSFLCLHSYPFYVTLRILFQHTGRLRAWLLPETTSGLRAVVSAVVFVTVTGLLITPVIRMMRRYCPVLIGAR